MSITKLAEKLFDELSQGIDFDSASKKEIFVSAFINGILYGESLLDEDLEIEVCEEQLDLPIH